jgi:putative peptidoglycan lipid II flippase
MRGWRNGRSDNHVPSHLTINEDEAGIAGGGKKRVAQLVRQSGLTSIAAAAAVVMGLFLDATIASHFGVGAATDSFFVGARIPLGFLAIVMVGANQVLVPVFSTWFTQKKPPENHRLTSLVLAGAALVTAAVAAVGMLVSHPLMRISAPGLGSADLALAASVARVMFLLVPLVSLAEVLRAFLNSRSAFIAPAGMNIVMNGLAAGIILVFAGVDIHLVAWAYVAGAGAQLAMLAIMADRRGFRFVSTLALTDPELRATGRLGIRPLLGAGLNPAARTCEQLVVSFLPSGSITTLNYGYRLISAIGGSVFFRSVMVTVLPRLTRATAGGDEAEVRRVTGLALQMMLALSLPLTAFMAVLSGPFVRVLFKRGNFTSANASLLGMVLAVYAASLVASALQRAMLAPFFARLDTRVPFRNSFYGVAANIALLAVIVLPLRNQGRIPVVGVALAYSLAQYVNLAHAWIRVRAIVPRPFAGLRATAVRVGTASAAGGLAMLFLSAKLQLADHLAPSVLLLRAALTAAGGIAAVAAVLVLLLLPLRQKNVPPLPAVLQAHR